MDAKVQKFLYKNHEIIIEDGLYYFGDEGYDTLQDAQNYIDKYVVANEIYDDEESWADEEERLYIEHWQHVSHNF